MHSCSVCLGDNFYTPLFSLHWGRFDTETTWEPKNGAYSGQNMHHGTHFCRVRPILASSTSKYAPGSPAIPHPHFFYAGVFNVPKITFSRVGLLGILRGKNSSLFGLVCLGCTEFLARVTGSSLIGLTRTSKLSLPGLFQDVVKPPQQHFAADQAHSGSCLGAPVHIMRQAERHKAQHVTGFNISTRNLNPAMLSAKKTYQPHPLLANLLGLL